VRAWVSVLTLSFLEKEISLKKSGRKIFKNKAALSHPHTLRKTWSVLLIRLVNAL